ncbi:hypothetical protein FRC17_002176, partial [Serendipita sp. 399]
SNSFTVEAPPFGWWQIPRTHSSRQKVLPQTHSNSGDIATFNFTGTGIWIYPAGSTSNDPVSGISNVSISVHTTNTSDAIMQYNFSANAISIFGNIGTNQGAYSVSLEYASGEEVLDQDLKLNEFYQARALQFFNASFPYNRTKVLLYHASNINASRVTTLTMKNIPDKESDTLTIDYTILLTYNYDNSSQPHRPNSVGPIVGSILGALILLGFALLMLYFLRQRRQGKLIRQQKLSGFRDLLARKGIIASPAQETKATTH